MKKDTIIFAGTTEGRELSEGLVRAGIPHILSVATDYGEMLIKESPLVQVHKGRMDVDEMKKLMENSSLVFDATHPYASLVTENIKRACRESEKPYVRILRESYMDYNKEKIKYFEDVKSCAKALAHTQGNILLTTGSKDLALFTAEGTGMKDRLYARVLPSEESIRLCGEADLKGEHVIAMQGPFNLEMNKALIGQFDIRTMVTKESGVTGGYPEKVQAAVDMGIDLFVIGRPSEEEGLTVSKALEKYAGSDNSAVINLIGTGPGNKSMLTKEAEDCISSSDIIFGARRMIADYQGSKTAYPYYLAEDVIPVLLNERPRVSSVLFSGDSGFYSGAEKMRWKLERALQGAGIDYSINVIPGISSLSCFAAKTGISYSDGSIRSIHGKSQNEEAIAGLIKDIIHNPKVFALLSGREDVNNIFGRLKAAAREENSSSIRMILGYELSYPNERIFDLTLEEDLPEFSEEGLYIASFVNENPRSQRLVPTIDDREFVRGKVPMTKSPIRHLSIAELNLAKGDVLYDVGSGTGSVGIQAAAMDPSLKVYGIEKKEEALCLMRENKEKFGTSNFVVVPGEAPEVLEELEMPTHAFVGGSGGNLKEILLVLRKKNPGMRVVLNAISLETISEITSLLKEIETVDLTIRQVAVSRSKEIGDYHMMTAENPILIVSFNFA